MAFSDLPVLLVSIHTLMFYILITLRIFIIIF